MRNLILFREHGLQLLSRHGVPVASDVGKQTEMETRYFMSMFVDRASHQAGVIFCRAYDPRDPYVHEQKFSLGLPSKVSNETKDLESTTGFINNRFNAQKASLFAHIAQMITSISSNQAEDLNISSYQYRPIVERVVQVFFDTEALLLETIFAFQSEAGKDASSIHAVDAHVILDDAAYKSCGRQEDIYERVTTNSIHDAIALQASRDGITYIKSAKDSPRYVRQADKINHRLEGEGSIGSLGIYFLFAPANLC